MADKSKAKPRLKQDPPPIEQPFLEHLIELRDRLMRVVMVVLVVFLGLFYFANDIYSYFAQPLMRHLPQGSSMIATEVASPFLTPFKLTLVLSVFIAVPVILYQLWAFIAPGLYKHERRLIYPLLVSSTVLFFVGVAFAYYVVLPLIFGFMVGIAPEGVAVMTDISKYLDFVLTVFFAFGIAFEVPIATILLIWSGIVSAADLAAKRPFIIVGAFVVGAILTPPDVFSQTLLAIPMWLLFEVGLFCSRWYTKPRKQEGEDEEEGDGGDGGTPAPKKPAPSSTPGSSTMVQTTASGATAFTLAGVAATSDAEAGDTVALTEAPTHEESAAAVTQAEQAPEEIQPTVSAHGEESTAKSPMAAIDGDVKVDEDEHARATAEAIAHAKAAAGDIGDYRERPYVLPEEPVFTEEDHQRITAEAMARSWAAAGVPPPVRKPLPPEPALAQDSPASVVDEQAEAAVPAEGEQTSAPEAPH